MLCSAHLLKEGTVKCSYTPNLKKKCVFLPTMFEALSQKLDMAWCSKMVFKRECFKMIPAQIEPALLSYTPHSFLQIDLRSVYWKATATPLRREHSMDEGFSIGSFPSCLPSSLSQGGVSNS